MNINRLTFVALLCSALAISGCDSNSLTTIDSSSDSRSTEYGYESTAWFNLSADACTDRDDAVVIDTLDSEADLSSSEFSCTQYNYGTEIVYSFEWTGDDFDKDGADDTLSFDLKVEAFDGTTYSYSETEGESSVTELGTAANLYYIVDDYGTSDDDSDDVGYWDIEGANDNDGIDIGQSLRFSIENMAVSATGYSADFDGFSAISVLETLAGKEHLNIIGFGTGLDSNSFSTTPGEYEFDAMEELVVTSAGDYYDWQIWSIFDIEFSFSISNPELEVEPDWLAGSWGVAHIVDGGYKLDAEADTSDYVAGAQQIVDNLPEVGHVITFFTHPAHPHLFTLREHPYIDVANDIHENMVPTLENEQIILDVIDVFREADKKVILYLNAAGPNSNLYNETLEEIGDAWVTYYTDEWDGDEGAAWRELVRGYAERFDGLVDGYWFDNAAETPGGHEAFIQVFRDIDPDLRLCLNTNKQYHTDENGDYIYVGSDGIDDDDDSDYKIIKYVPTNEYDDYNCGHITPLGQGAPPNSFAYEEFTIPAMVEEPTATYDGRKYALKHGWFPIRTTWHGENSDLVFETEQAYRFTRTITDAGAAMTWSNTNLNGYMSDDEMLIMQEINDRMAQEPMESYEAYERPEGACLIGEDDCE
ncbi:hypothetical protein [Reinekea marinisedimentorum]|uniref:Endo-alpha(1,4)-fucoidanase Mef1 domain-containing protein n=1 Tax=Reinekea marinisedimentorum TaxID=230495 RepID=A0A4R3IBD0_9GAMM|nr:hypothetical protein [Reinekea marinisedimentorum]TCS43294.1 hypothetical protein BCF53_102320 [Reinekea marinisedimentorum]